MGGPVDRGPPPTTLQDAQRLGQGKGDGRGRRGHQHEQEGAHDNRAGLLPPAGQAKAFRNGHAKLTGHWHTSERVSGEAEGPCNWTKPPIPGRLVD